MYREAERLLKLCIKLASIRFNTLQYDELLEKSSTNENRLRQLLQYLQSENMIRIGGLYSVIVLTVKGRNYFKKKHVENIKFMKRSILTPILVSVITTGLIWLIGLWTGLLQKIILK